MSILFIFDFQISGETKMRTSPTSAVTRLKIIFVIDLIIVALAVGGYYYVNSLTPPLKKAEFQVTNLTIDPLEAEVGEPILISGNVTNVGDEEGSYSANLTINDVLKQNQTIMFSGGESRIIEFTDVENAEGNYTVKMGGLSGSFRIKAAPPTTSNISLFNLFVRPYEAWIGEPISINVTAKNLGTETDSLSVKLMIDEVLADSKIVQLGAGETTTVEFTANATSEGIHKIKVNTLFSGFAIVPTGMHTLLVVSSPKQGVPVTLNGVEHKTPYSELLPVGVSHTVEVPAADPTGQFTFLKWEDGSTNPTRKIILTDRKTITADFSGGTSCPSLYIWNGTSYVYVSEVSNHGWLGYINYINDDPDWPIVFWRNNPWDYIKLDKSQLQPRAGTSYDYYDIVLTQRWNEIFYLDAAYMLVVDHPSDVNVYSTMVEQYIDPNYMGKIYTASKNPLTPISAVNEKGENVLPHISSIDGIFTPGINGINSPSWDNISWNRVTLDLGDLSDAQQIKLVVRGIVDWGSADDYTIWIDKFFAQPVPNGTQITPPPYMEVKDADGNWVRVPDNRQFPIPPDGVPRTFVVDLTGLFPTNDYSLRINNFWNVTFDYIGVDITPQENVTIQRIDPYASLYQAFNTSSAASGNFTRYGDVTQLVLNEDDMFVIGKQGDEVSLQFPASNIAPPAEGMERDFFFYVSLWFKDETGNWGFGFGFTVEPLPFQDMSGFPYPPTESYPYAEDHLYYLLEYNTRTITIP